MEIRRGIALANTLSRGFCLLNHSTLAIYKECTDVKKIDKMIVHVHDREDHADSLNNNVTIYTTWLYIKIHTLRYKINVQKWRILLGCN